MDGWQPMLGLIVAWVLVIGASAAAGTGMVVAWARWGGALPMPGRVRAVVARALGPLPAAAGGLVVVEHDEAEEHDAHVPPAQASLPPAAPEPEPTPPAPEPTPAAAAPGAPTEPAPQTPAEPAAAVVAVATERPAASPPRMPRADALEEMTALLGLTYEQAVAALEAGLWGLDNLEEWSRAMRQSAPPEKLPAEVLARILATPIPEVSAKRDQFHVRRAALRTLEELWGVGPGEASALYDAGFQDVAALRKASTDKLAKVPGIGASRAFQIRAAAFGLAPTP